MLAHLWASADAPLEYVTVTLCREMHCTPGQLRKENMTDIGMWLTVLSAENKVAKLRSGKGKRGRDY